MAGRRARFEKLAMPVVDSLYRQAMKLTNNPDDAQDLVQDTFERGFKAFDSFKEGTNFAAWMTTIERNAYSTSTPKPSDGRNAPTIPPANTMTGTCIPRPNIPPNSSNPPNRNTWTPTRRRRSWPL